MGLCGAELAELPRGSQGASRASRRRAFHCSQCGRSFRYACNLRAHAAKHGAHPPLQGHPGHPGQQPAGVPAPFSCPECAACFALAPELASHLRQHAVQALQALQQHHQHHRLDLHKLAALEHRISLGSEEKTVSEAKPAGRRASIVVRLIGGQAPLSCVECGRRFSTLSQLRSHGRRHQTGSAGSAGVASGTRGGGLACRGALQSPHGAHGAHQLQQSPFFRCRCGAAFHSPHSLSAHRLVHLRKRPFHCTQCPADFSNAWNLARHYKEHLQNLCVLSLSDLRCSVCNENFRTNEVALRRHRALHKDVRYCKCRRCGSVFRSGWDWKEHVAECAHPLP